MMIKGEDPAFPCVPESGDRIRGMSLRDHFASLAMQAYLSSDFWREDMTGQRTASAAYKMADYMLMERLK